MRYPHAVDVTKVGEYPALSKSGGGYFFDHVLEYRVWCHPTGDEGEDEDTSDYYYAFASYEEALECSNEAPGAEKPLVLVRQLEWVNEPEKGVFLHERGERITEWRVEWLDRGARQPGAIEAFIKERTTKSEG